MGRGFVISALRMPSVRQVRTDQDQIAVVIGRDMVAHIAPAMAVERERQFEFGMVMPKERQRLKLAIEQAQEACSGVATFSKWSRPRLISLISRY